MKKVILLAFVAIVSISAVSAQKFQKPSFQVGIASALPTDIASNETHINFGSTWFQLNSKYNKKFSGALDFGYLRFKGDSETNFSVVPFMVGPKYHVNEHVYFGGAAGVAFYNNSDYGATSFMFSPYIGAVMGSFRIDGRYISIVEKNKPVKVLGIVLSYSL